MGRSRALNIELVPTRSRTGPLGSPTVVEKERRRGVIGTMVLLINISWWRIGNRLGYLEGNRFLGAAGWLVRGGTDLFLWIGLGVIVAVMMVAGLAI